MTYLVTDACIRCKYTTCVEVCPVDCFHEGENMLVIDPLTCIDCGVCVPECPAGAIEAESEELLDWLEFNSKYSKEWPVIATVKSALENADDYNPLLSKNAEQTTNKKQKFFNNK